MLRRLPPSCLGLMMALSASLASAQQVETLNVSGPPPELVHDKAVADAAATTPTDVVDLGQAAPTTRANRPAGAGAGGTVAGMSLPAPLTANVRSGIARNAARQATLRQVGPAPLTGSAAGPAERTLFSREPVRVHLAVGQERMVTLPADALLHVPSDMASVARIESIGGTIYMTALVPFTPIRIVAELLDSGQQIPMDLVAEQPQAQGAVQRGELQVSVVEPATVLSPTATAAPAPASTAAAAEEAAADMVQLTRHAARQLYAPRRLANTVSGVRQVEVGTEPVPALLRGAHVEAVPVGQWKSGALYVTAVRITNRSRYALELPLESVRGRWIAATAQHGRIGPAGSDTDTTAIYLVCERAFEACLQ